MIKLAFKTFKSFCVEKKGIFILMIFSLIAFDFTFFFSTQYLLNDKSILTEQIIIEVKDLECIEEISGIILNDNDYLKYLDVYVSANLTDGRNNFNRNIGFRENDCDLKNIEYISTTEFLNQTNEYIIFASNGSVFFPNCKCGDVFFVEGRELVHVADALFNNIISLEGMVSKETFYSIFKNMEGKNYQIYAVYDVGISSKKLDALENKLNQMEVENVNVNKYKFFNLSDILVLCSNSIVLLSLIICLIMYSHFINSRLRDYTILKITGISKNNITILYLVESFAVHTISFILTALVFYLYLLIIGYGTYGYMRLMIYGYTILFVLFTLINIPYVGRIRKKSTIEIYIKSRRIG